MVAKKFVAFDLGAESGRAVLGSLNSDRLVLEEIHRFPNEPVQVLGCLHWDVLSQFREMKKGLSKAVHLYGDDLAGVGVDTWGVDFGLIGKGGLLLGNPVHYRDSRTDGILEKAFEVVPKDKIFEATGIQFMQFNTAFQLYAMKLQGSPLLEMAESLLLMPDLFNFLFTGEKLSEFSIATTTQLYDPSIGTWSDELIKCFGLPRGIFQDIVQPGTVVAGLLPAVAEEVGAKGLRVIAPAGHDTGSAVAAVPAEGDGYAFISCGTWSLMGIETKEPIINETTARYNFTNEGAVGGYRMLKNIMGLWLVQECRRAWLREGEELGYGELTQMASEAPSLRSFVVPNDDCFLRPANMPKEIQDYCRRTGQPVPSTKGEIIRCALESLALTYRWTLDKLEEILGRRLSVVHMVGGGIQNKLLCRLAADAMGVPVAAGPIEATAIGNILVQAIAAGYIKDLSEARGIIRNSFPIEAYEPNAGLKDAWDAAYNRFLQYT